MKKVGFTILILSFLTISFVQAQSLGDSPIPGINEQIDVSVSPQNPAPGESVTISLAAYSFDLSRADISWLVNGSVVQNGVGESQLNLTAGNVGSSQRVDIFILPQGASTKIEREVIIRPASVDIAWESGAYTPPFYKGKALYPPGGNLIFVALPNLSEHGVALSSKNLVYTWSIDGTILGSQSGYGKNTLTYTGTEIIRPFTVEVTASSLDKAVSGEGSLTMSTQNPSVLFYESSPLYGVLFNRSLSNQISLNGNEMDLAAYPYSFVFNVAASPSAKYSWNINGSPISLPTTQNKVTFRKTDDQHGASAISLSLENISNFLQSASNNLVINF